MLPKSNSRTFLAVAIGLATATVVPNLPAQDKKPDAPAPAAKRPARAPNPVLQPVEDVAGLPRVLLIGDSISMGYTVPVRTMLEGKANVHRPLTNCGPTTKGLEEIDEWLATGGADKTWDVIHFNWGLHDLKYLGADGKNLADPKDPSSHQQVPPEEYRENLSALAERLRETGAKLIWRNTTPVPEGAAGRVPGDSARYNVIAAEIMEEKGIPIHDLYSFAKEREKEIQREANVHYTEEGSRKLAADVVRVIEATLSE